MMVERLFLLMFCSSDVRLKWIDGELSTETYSVQEAIFMLDNFNGYSYAVVEEGFFKGWSFV